MRSRRWFLRTSGLAVGVLGTSGIWCRPAFAQGRPSRKVLVAVLQRGAADGLNIVVPSAEKRYYQLRPGIGIPVPGRTRRGELLGTIPGMVPPLIGRFRECHFASRCPRAIDLCRAAPVALTQNPQKNRAVRCVRVADALAQEMRESA